CNDVFGYSPEEMTNCRSSVAHPDDAVKVKEALEEALKGRSGSNFEYRITTKGGAVKWISHSWSPITSDGKLRMIVGVMRDITDRRKMEEELIKAQKLESVSVLAGGIAHDFNNILTAVWGYLSLAKAAARPMKEVVELLAEAEKASVRARDLTQQLLTFSRGGTPVKNPLALGAVLKDAAGFALSGSNVRCEMAVPENLWLAEANEGQVSQVINNLVLNAIQAMPRGGVIRISARNVRAGSVEGMPLSGRDYVMISVRDEGIGIPEEQIQKIFDPYFTTKQRGSGLGLSISYSIVRNHDGAITVTSALGEGTTFRVYLPVAETQAVPEVRKANNPPNGTGRILFMDDDEVVRSVGRRMLEHLGYEVAIAGDGGEMLASYGKAMEDGKPFDAVIMDLTIPGLMGGREAIAKLLLLDPRARAIVSSGYSNDPVTANLAEYGFAGFVPKPYRIEEFAAELRRVLSGGDAA
ncbi:MAG: ATP-binding protein, partial [Chlamydiota bacterium]